MNIAVFLPNWIGDVVMATPLLRALRDYFGDGATLTGVMRPYVAEVLSGSAWLDEHLFLNPRAKQPGLGNWQLVRSLRHRRIDLAVLLPNSFRSALLAWLGGAKQRIGHDHQWRGLLLNRSAKPPRHGGKLMPTSAIDVYLDLAYQIGCPPQSRMTQLETTPDDEARAGEVFRALGIAAEDNVVLLNPAGGGNSESAVRGWPTQYFANLSRRIVADHDVHVLTVCGPREEKLARQIDELADHPRVHSLADHPVSIGPLKACVRRGRMMITTDTGPRHFAAAFDVPQIVLCGPIDPRWSEHRHPRETLLMQEIACRPCDKRFCPPGHQRCMKDLAVDRVYAAVAGELKRDVPRARSCVRQPL
jgi:heptosyltransferase-2